MTEAPRSRRCDDYQQDLAELALGVLTGRQRAATLAHVDSCDHCAEELEQLSRTADAVVYVAPEEEPPVGFEVRLFNRMGLAENASAPPAPLRRGPARWSSSRGRWALAAAAAVVALVAGLSIGWVTGSSGNHPTQGVAGVHSSREVVATADLVEQGRSVGRVVTGGSPVRLSPPTAWCTRWVPSPHRTGTAPGTRPSRWRPATCARQKWSRPTGR